MARRIEDEVGRLSDLRRGDPAAAVAPLRKALDDRVNMMVAKAAAMAGELRLADLTPDLLRAYDRLFEGLPKSDPQCWGKNAIARALSELDYTVSTPFVRGAVHVQMEPSWGGAQDTAGPLRAICLLALPACGDIRREEIMRLMVNGLTDSDIAVRSESARGLAAMGGDDAALVLRLKARIGDHESQVTGQVLESLLAVERARALPFVKTFLDAAGGESAEEAALALGGSRMAGAVDVLLDAWPVATGDEYREALLRALAISRDDRAVEFLKKLAAEGRDRDAKASRAALDLLPEAARNG
jgi:hypothetical protein